MIEEIAREKLRLVRLNEGKQTLSHVEGWDILNEMLLMIKEYYKPPGYRTMKKSWDEGSFFKGGKLTKGNFKVGNIIGEVVDFISPSVEIERIIDKYVKAIAVVETWRTEDRFVEAWENNVFGGDYNERSDVRYVYLGWKMVKHIGVDHPVTSDNELDSRMVTHTAQFTRSMLSKFWNRAVLTVKAMLILDCLDMCAYNSLYSGVDRPFRYGWVDDF
jgi:hypothetical protein